MCLFLVVFGFSFIWISFISFCISPSISSPLSGHYAQKIGLFSCLFIGFGFLFSSIFGAYSLFIAMPLTFLANYFAIHFSTDWWGYKPKFILTLVNTLALYAVWFVILYFFGVNLLTICRVNIVL
jgi:hypothetical protein